MPYTYIGVNNGNGWKNLPSRETPRNAANFNVMENGIKGAYQGLNELDSKIDREVDAINQDISAINQDISAVNARVDTLESMTDLAVIDTQSGSFVQSTIADDCVVEVTIEGKTVITVADPSRDISPDNPATIKSVGDNAFDVVATGKNLLVNNAASSTTINGITFTVNPDKSITMNGTATGNANFPIFGVNWNDISSRMPLNPSQTYVLSRGSANAIVYLRDAISNKNFETPLGGTRLITGISQFTYVYIQVAAGRTCNNETIYPQLEIGSVATSYEPYKGSNKITISSSHRSLPNGLRDTYEFINDKLYKVSKVEYTVITKNDVSDIDVNLTTTTSTTAVFLFHDTRINSKAASVNMYCSHFKVAEGNGDYEHIRFDAAIVPRLKVWINKSRLEGWNETLTKAQKVDLFRNWINANNVIVQYELVNPVYTEAEKISLTTYKGTTNILTTSQLQPTLAAKFYSRLGNFAEVIMARLDRLTQALLALGGTV